MDARVTVPDTADSGAPSPAAPMVSDFNIENLRSWVGVIAVWALDYPRVLVLNWVLRLLRISKFVIVTRYEDVQEVLSQDEVFEVDAIGERFMKLTDSRANFLLGMSNGPEYQQTYRDIAQAFSRDDLPRIKKLSADMSETILAARPDGKIDAIEGLITLVPTRICQEYYGLPINDEVGFAQWAIAMSSVMFAPPGKGNPSGWETALAGARRLCAVVDEAIAGAKERARAGQAAGSVIERLVKLGYKDEMIRAYMVGMVLGFVPTNTIAAGNILEMLLQHPGFMERTRKAALDNDEDLLRRCLFEALRFKPIRPGQFRLCKEQYTIAAGTSRAIKVPKGSTVLASSPAAMRDSRSIEKPDEFNPNRPRSDYMLFGYGQHWCIGAYIAETQITQTFKALLRKGYPRPVDGVNKVQRIGVFPVSLKIEFNGPQELS